MLLSVCIYVLAIKMQIRLRTGLLIYDPVHALTSARPAVKDRFHRDMVCCLFQGKGINGHEQI